MRQLALTCVVFAICYLLELAASYWLFPERVSTIDTAYAKDTIYCTEPRFAVYGRERLSDSARKVILVGSSNVREGFRPRQLAEFISGVEFHNIAVGASDIRQLSEVVQLVLAAVPQADRRNLTIVLGIWYGSFVDEGRRWRNGPTDVDAEMLRYGLYRQRSSGIPAARFDVATMPYAIAAIRPFMLASRLYNVGVSQPFDALRERMKDVWDGRGISTGTVEADQHVLTAAEQDRAVKFWEEYMGSPQEWRADGFDILCSIATQISSVGARLVLVDMPLPNWHRDRVPYDRIYQARLTPYLGRLSLLPGFSYASLREGFDDNDYYDSAHPRPRITGLWASRLARIIEPVLTDR